MKGSVKRSGSGWLFVFDVQTVDGLPVCRNPSNGEVTHNEIAQRAYDLGLVTSLVEPGQAEVEATRIAERVLTATGADDALLEAHPPVEIRVEIDCVAYLPR